jgi:hypothetical protein
MVIGPLLSECTTDHLGSLTSVKPLRNSGTTWKNRYAGYQLIVAAFLFKCSSPDGNGLDVSARGQFSLE